MTVRPLVKKKKVDSQREQKVRNADVRTCSKNCKGVQHLLNTDTVGIDLFVAAAEAFVAVQQAVVVVGTRGNKNKDFLHAPGYAKDMRHLWSMQTAGSRVDAVVD